MKVGDTITLNFTLNENVYQGFINVFGDKNPLHTQPQFAQQYGFTDRVMHGNILNGYLSYAIGEQLPIKNVAILQQDIKYIKPVYLNQAITLSLKVAEYHQSVQAYILKFEYTAEPAGKLAKGSVTLKVLT